MAKKEILTIGSVPAPAINIHFTVGTGGTNDKADVMLIQAMFSYIGSAADGSPELTLGFPPSEVPEITGICDPKTKRAIFRFQHKNAKSLLGADGLIHPASYKGRNIKAGTKRMMTITLLHFVGLLFELYHQDNDYIDGLMRVAPELRSSLM